MATSRETILKTAQVLVDQQKLGQAIQEYQRILSADPSDTRTLLKIGDLEIRLGRFEHAIATYDRVGRHYVVQGLAPKALAVFRQVHQLIKTHAPALRTKYPDVLPELGRLSAELGQTGEALAMFDEYANTLQQEGRDNEALRVFHRMVALDAENPLPHLRLAEASCRVQALPEAIQSFWRAAELLLAKQRPNDAIKVIERILHFKPEPRFARAAAELYLQRGTHEDGLQALAKLQISFKADPRNLDTLALLAQAFTSIGQDAKAVEVYKEMARLAREQDQPELVQQLMEHLRQVAPEAAKALRGTQPGALDGAPRAEPGPPLDARQTVPRGRGASAEPPRARWSDPSELSVDDSDIEVLSEPSVYPPKALPSVPPPRGKAPRLVLSTDLEITEEGPAEYAASPIARKAIVNAESFRKLRLFGKAIETLHRAIEQEPLSIPIRQRLREILLDAGDRESALAEGLNIATIYADRGDLSNAEPLLHQFLSVHPHDADALSLLVQLGEMRGPSGDRESSIPELELDEQDDVGTEQEPLEHDLNAPLPSFPLSLPPAPPPGHFDAKVGRDSVIDTIEAALDEAEFYASQELYPDAVGVLEEQLKRYPKHPLLLERLTEIQTQAGTSRAASQTIYRTEFKSKEIEEIDIDASLDILDEMGLDADELVPEAASAVRNEQIDVDQVFEQFKAGVAAQVSESDSATHYDLGVAYKEMGLLDDAVHEFELAARDIERRCMCFAMVGLIHLEQERFDEAYAAYTKALDTPHKSIDQEMNLHFDLGNVQELRGKIREALSYFEKVARRDPTFRNVEERIASLRPSQPPGRLDMDEEDEYERALNKLFR